MDEAPDEEPRADPGGGPGGAASGDNHPSPDHERHNDGQDDQDGQYDTNDLAAIDGTIESMSSATWALSWQVLAKEYWDKTLYDLADRLKLERFDVFLHSDLGRARRYGRYIYRLGQAAGNSRVMALGLLARGDAARQGGHARRAMPLFERSGDLFLAAGDQIGWARARGGWLIAATHAGLVTERDVDAMDEACDVLRRAGQTLRLANVRQNVGLAYLSLARYRKAVATYTRTLKTLGRGVSRPERNLRALLLMNLGYALLWQVDKDRARDCLERARAIFQDIGNTGMAALVDVHLCVAERRRWHLHDAFRLVRKAVPLLVEAKQPSAALAQVYETDILLLLNRPEEARLAAWRAVDMLSRLQVPQDLEDALCLQARALWQCGDISGADLALRQAAHLFADQTTHHNAYPLVIERALLLLEQDRAVEAKETALDVLRRPASQDTAVHRAMALWVAAEAALKLGHIALAQKKALETLRAADRLNSPELRYRGHLIQARLARRAGNLAVALDHYEAVSEALRTCIGELVYEQRTGFLQDKSAIYMEALQTALTVHNTPKALAFLEQERTRASWALLPGPEALEAMEEAGGERAQLARSLIALEQVRTHHRSKSALLGMTSHNSPTYKVMEQDLLHLTRQIRDLVETVARRIKQPAAIDIASLPERVADDTVVVAYALARDDLIIFSIRRAGIESWIVEGGAIQVGLLDEALQLTIDTLTQQLERADPAEAPAVLARWGSQLRQALHGLWTLLIAPVLHLLPSEGGTVAIVPHGPLHALPLHALYDGERYLIERYTVQCLDACQALTNVGDAEDEQSPWALTLGYSHHTLPHAESEAHQIAALLGGEAWIGADATGTRLLKRLREGGARPTYLHVAAHGDVRLDIPSASFVLLADGPFHPTDAVALDLRGCRLVTLSACKTGLGRVGGGDEQIGLVRAFCHAGAEAVLSTLWQVDDATTFTFMQHFYERLAQGFSPADALRGAQRAFIHDGGSHAHPYFWAGFQLMTQVVRTPKSGSFSHTGEGDR